MTWSQRLRENLVHLRIKNTLHVAPVVLFAISQVDALHWDRILLTVGILHLLIFPASVGYNAYYDKDEAPTGGIEKPPEVHVSLLWLVWGLEAIALGLSVVVNLYFTAFIAVTILASRAYSSDRTRVKGMPVVGYIWVAFFQGGFSYVMVMVGISADPLAVLQHVGTLDILLPALFCTFLVAGSYPLSQVYQFEEDAARGDVTIAMLLGYNGTFLVCQAVLTVGWVVVAAYFFHIDKLGHLALLTALFLAPGGFVGWWWLQVRKDTGAADHTNAVRMGWISALFGGVCFVALAVLNHVPQLSVGT